MSDLESDDEGDIPATAKGEDEEAEDQVNGELKDEVEETQPKSEEVNEDEDEVEDEDDDDDDDDVAEDEYELPSRLRRAAFVSLNSVQVRGRIHRGS